MWQVLQYLRKQGIKHSTCWFKICINGIEIQLANYKFICNTFESLCIEHTFACVLFDAHNVFNFYKIGQLDQLDNLNLSKRLNKRLVKIYVVINEHETMNLHIYQNFILHEIHIRNECCFEEHP